MSGQITITAAAPATYDADGNLVALVAYSADQARDPAGTDTGGQFASDSSDQSESQNDEEAKNLYRQMLNLPPGQRAAFLKGLSNDQLTRLGKFASTGKEAKGPIADIKNAVGQAMTSRGLNVGTAGLKAKGGAKKAGAKKGGSGKSSGGGSKSGSGKSSGGSKKSSGGSKSGGSKSSGSSSKKSSSSSGSKKTTSSSSSSSKKTDDSAKTSKTSTGKQTAPTPAPVRITPSRPPTPAPPRIGPPGGGPRPQPVRASGTAASAAGGRVRIVARRTEEDG